MAAWAGAKPRLRALAAASEVTGANFNRLHSFMELLLMEFVYSGVYLYFFKKVKFIRRSQATVLPH
jgi:hypothetical protein